MSKLSNFFDLFKRNLSLENNNINDNSISNEHENAEFNLKDNNYNLNQIDNNENISTLNELRVSNYSLNNTFSNESDFLKLFKYDSIADSSKTFNIETALNNNWDKVDNFAKDVSQEMEQKADKIHTHTGYEPANVNIQQHIVSAHAPSNAEQNVQSDWNVSDQNSDSFIKNKPTALPANGGNADTLDGLDSTVFSVCIPNPTTGTTIANHINKYVKAPYNYKSANFFCTYVDSSDLPVSGVGVINYRYDSAFTSIITVTLYDYVNLTMWVRNFNYVTVVWDTPNWINLRKPINHASGGAEYGLGTPSIYGHVATTNVLTQGTHIDGLALSAYQGYVLNNTKAPKHQSGTTAPSSFVGDGVLYGVYS